ncbi:MAG: fused acetyl/propionyl-CoA carboxylase subunit alpha/methylmalonyl-CoA decarboxylase subunit alpha, partial [Phenylobacterium zucineum]
ADRLLAQLCAHLMGYDTEHAPAVLADYLAARDEARAQGADLLGSEIGLVTLFADLAELSRNRPAGELDSTELRIHSDREHFHGYLQSLDASRAGLPDAFVQRLSRALAHYGVDELDRTPALEDAVFRIFLAQQRVADDVQVVLAILDRWIGEPAPNDQVATSARSQLERLVRATQRRFPAVSDVARSVRFRWFDQPQVDAEREQVLAGVADQVADLAAHPDAPDYAERIALLAAIPERLVLTLAERLAEGVVPHEPLLEILIRKHYGDHQLSDVRAFTVSNRSVVTADYVLKHRPTRVISTVAVESELTADGPVAAIVAEQLGARRPGDDAVVELYVGWPGIPGRAELSATVQDRFADWSLPGGVRRVVVAACSPDGEIDYVTLRPDTSGTLVEDARVHGVHPMVFRRLNLWRLREFDATRLPAPRGVLLFDCVAKSNPEDRRLVAMAEVNQLAAVRDRRGRLIGLPHAERAVENCLEAIRRTRAARGSAGS